MRQFSIILLLTFLLGCKTEYRKTIDTYSNGKTKIEYVYPDKANLIKYTIIEYFNNGQISFEATVDNNKFVGVKNSYFENGNLMEVDSIINPCDLNNCCCDGKVSKYYTNGKLELTFENRNGVANGQVVLYGSDSSGKIWSIRSYQDGKKNGVSKTFYQSGRLYKIETFRNDLLVDHVFYFKENGDTMKVNYTWNGQEDFPSKKWLDNGQIFYATYLYSSYNKALYRWTDKTGKELRRVIISQKAGGEWITSNGKWITPN
jgi:antitoxin component YwqK of YwqJK toxin-antitoxin module